MLHPGNLRTLSRHIVLILADAVVLPSFMLVIALMQGDVILRMVFIKQSTILSY